MKFQFLHYYSLLYCSSYFLIGLMEASIGPLIPIKAKEIGILETDFAFVFIVGGIGGLLGSQTCNKLEKYFSWHQILAISYLLLSLSAIILAATKNILLFAFAQLILNYSIIVVNIITTIALLEIQKQSSQFWFKILHASFSIWAFLTPIILSIYMTKALYYYAFYGVILAGLYLIIKFPKTSSQQMDKLIVKQQKTLQIVPNSLHFLLMLFFFIYIGNQGCFAGWISTYGVMSNDITLNQALYAPGIFWLFVTIWRFLSIFMTLIWTIEAQINILITGLLILAVLGVIFALNGLDIFILYIISGGFGVFMSSMYPLLISVPNYYGYTLKTQHTSKYGLASCIAMLSIYYITGLGMSYFGRYYFIFSEFALTICLFIICKLIINFDRKNKKQTEMSNL